MREETFYLDEGHVKITAASVGISSRRWTCINAATIEGDNYKSIMKDKKAELKLVVNDILNQNQAFRRSTQLNYVQDERINALGRYWQLQFIYRLNKSPMGEGRGGRGMRMRMGT